MIQKIKLNLVIWCFGLKPAIKKLDKENYKKIMRAFKKHYLEINARTEKKSGVVGFHMMACVIGLAFYKVLPDYIQDRNEVIDIIHDILWKPRMSKNVRFIAFFVRRSKDPFNNFLKFLGPRNEWFFPCLPWEKELVDIENGVGWKQTKCPYYDFFKKENALEVTRAYCDFDSKVAALLSDHIELKREKTLAKGNSYCDFLYYKK
ncbi:MAG: hypothetical protein HOG03_22030 [Desulfobacula sp.]|jgi:hypothetical protein|uniref:L-2-amino-thiazoline-4-carboxylic acid hydrolase n=1 Tax=Desulfobacula sp. TaxID=2593537 RepID=UPI001D726202|nr:hypothetical protein [Desulfobacula sp.]MBT4200156.1 hypothetical protein [Desulfobacula sp.]MBT4508969.1 hypothetical protein [Desulfobacula sp.]MBT4877546.1 hypothetical protein [Desulfobacula sp.]MBT5545367.1 hypothetical protein [Desulfobacula sp.]